MNKLKPVNDKIVVKPNRKKKKLPKVEYFYQIQ